MGPYPTAKQYSDDCAFIDLAAMPYRNSLINSAETNRPQGEYGQTDFVASALFAAFR
jgi:hypothetical protein